MAAVEQRWRKVEKQAGSGRQGQRSRMFSQTLRIKIIRRIKIMKHLAAGRQTLPRVRERAKEEPKNHTFCLMRAQVAFAILKDER